MASKSSASDRRPRAADEEHPAVAASPVAEEYSLALTESGENYLHFAIAEATLRKLISVELKELRVIGCGP